MLSTKLETQADELAVAVTQVLVKRKRCVFERVAEPVCREHVDATLSALRRDLDTGKREAVREIVDAMFTRFAEAGLNFSDLRYFAQALRGVIRGVYEDTPPEVLEVEDWLAELVVVSMMRFIGYREAQLQRETMKREVAQHELRLASLQAALDEKTQLVEEIQQLNRELRRQIAQHSSRLMSVLLDRNRELRAPSMLDVGEMLADCYRVVARLGEGGMGAVFEVERTTDGVHLAAKIIKHASERKRIARFMREAQILASVTHPNLIAIHDVDFDDRGLLYIVMELAHTSLRERVPGRADVGWHLAVFHQVCEALALLHDRAIIHRDLKPENILLMPTAPGADPSVARPQIKLADFGIAVALDDSQTEGGLPGAGAAAEARDSQSETLVDDSLEGSLFTGTGVLLGTPVYMAPELARGSRHAQAASDVFSFGVIAYEYLLGALPFSHPAVFAAPRRSDAVTEALLRCPGLAPEVARALGECLDPEPEARPSARQLAALLFDSGLGVGAQV